MLLYTLDELFYNYDQVKCHRSIDEKLVVAYEILSHATLCCMECQGGVEKQGVPDVMLQNAFYPFSSTSLCTMLFTGFSAVCWFSCFLSCHARNVHWFGGIVVRGCTSRSLLGSYVHQELI